MLLQAKLIAYSASISGQHLTQELYQRLGITNEVMGKSRLIGGGKHVGVVIKRGEAWIGFQQISKLMPVPSIAHVTHLPSEAQKVSMFSAGFGKSTTDPALAQAVISFLPSPAATGTINRSGL
jgi:molybdate transport system substrate-binding protein